MLQVAALRAERRRWEALIEERDGAQVQATQLEAQIVRFKVTLVPSFSAISELSRLFADQNVHKISCFI